MERYYNWSRDLDTAEPVPLSAISVYDAGTLDLAAIYADNLGTPTAKANPFLADQYGFFYFYAEDGRYDVHVGSPAPVEYTIGDVLLGLGGAGLALLSTNNIWTGTNTWNNDVTFNNPMEVNAVANFNNRVEIRNDINDLAGANQSAGLIIQIGGLAHQNPGAALNPPANDGVTAAYFYIDSCNDRRSDVGDPTYAGHMPCTLNTETVVMPGHDTFTRGIEFDFHNGGSDAQNPHSALAKVGLNVISGHSLFAFTAAVQIDTNRNQAGDGAGFHFGLWVAACDTVGLQFVDTSAIGIPVSPIYTIQDGAGAVALLRGTGTYANVIDLQAATVTGNFFIGGDKLVFSADGRMGLGRLNDWAGMVGPGISMGNIIQAPVTGPSTGGLLFVLEGALYYRGQSGTVTGLAPP